MQYLQLERNEMNEIDLPIDDLAYRIRCMNCGKSVSTPVPKETVVRAWVECPECIEKKTKWKENANQKSKRD
jgi:DNA-directed RNA polymerase subunit RPC12/RpoP